MEHEEGLEAALYRSTIGDILEDNDVSSWAQMWEREVARGWTVQTKAHASVRAIHGGSLGNAFRKQLLTVPEDLIPAMDDRCSATTIVRHASEVGYSKEYRSRQCQPVAPNAEAPHAHFVVMPPPYLARPGPIVPYKTLTTCRYQPNNLPGYLVGWHQAEFPICPISIRAAHYVKVPLWWPTVEVPFGAMVELPYLSLLL